MNWQDIVLEKAVGPAELRAAVAKAFGVEAGEVHVVESVADAPAGAPVIAETTTLEGDFRLQVSLYVGEKLAEKDPLDVIRRLCSALQTQALIPDSSPNPYAMILIDHGLKAHLVALDADSLNNREEYRLSTQV
jgi:hypothetical protein